MSHPRTIEEISAPWLTDVLRGAGILRRVIVRAVDIQAIGEGLGFLRGRARVTISYDQHEDGAPASVVVKLPASNKAGSDFAESLHAYEREIRFYREVAPRTPIRVPRVFATIMEPADSVFILVMEDLNGLTVGDQVRVMRGPLSGVSGILQKQKDTYRLILSIELLGRSAAVEVDAASVERIPAAKQGLGYRPWTEQALNLSN